MDVSQFLSALLASAALAAVVWLLASLIAGDEARGRRIAALAAMRGASASAPSSHRLLSGLERLAASTRGWRAGGGLVPDRERLVRAGLRGERGEAAYLGVQLLCLAGALLAAALLIALPGVRKMGPSGIAVVLFALAYAVLRIPKFFLARRIKTRQTEMRRAWPEVLDLMVIQVEAGRSPEQALRRVREDMVPRAPALAEELALTIAELDVFDRRQAYDNLAQRVDFDDVRATCSALIQAYEQGSSLADAFRTLAKESRDARFIAAEKKAAQITSALPLPVAIFFLLPLVLVLVAPAVIHYMKWH